MTRGTGCSPQPAAGVSPSLLAASLSPLIQRGVLPGWSLRDLVALIFLPNRKPGPTTDSAGYGRWRGVSTQVQTFPLFQRPAPSWQGEGKQPGRKGLPAGLLAYPEPTRRGVPWSPAGSKETEEDLSLGQVGGGAPAMWEHPEPPRPALPRALLPPGSLDIRLKAGDHPTPILSVKSGAHRLRPPLLKKEAACGGGGAAGAAAADGDCDSHSLKDQQEKGQGRGPAVTWGLLL